MPFIDGVVILITLDLKTLYMRMMDDKEMLRRVASQFLEETPHYIDAMQRIIEKADPSEAAKQAHLIKGSAANINAEAMRQVACEMETDAKAGNLVGLSGRMPELRRQYELLTKALTQEIG